MSVELCACGCGNAADSIYDAEGIPGLMDCHGAPYALHCRNRSGLATRIRMHRAVTAPPSAGLLLNVKVRFSVDPETAPPWRFRATCGEFYCEGPSLEEAKAGLLERLRKELCS